MRRNGCSRSSEISVHVLAKYATLPKIEANHRPARLKKRKRGVLELAQQSGRGERLQVLVWLLGEPEWLSLAFHLTEHQ